MSGLDRREFLGWLGKGALAAWLAHQVRPSHASVVRAQALPDVVAAQGADQDSEEAVLAGALAGLGGIERFVKPGMSVAIKPNATWAYPPHTASSSDPEVLRALIRIVKQAGAAKVIVMDHCSIEPGAGPALAVSGIGQVVKDEGVEGLFPDRNNAPLTTFTKIDLPDGQAFQRLGVIQAALDVDLRINLAVAKTHNVTRMTLCLKHMMGFLQSPGLLHSDLEQGIADLSTATSPIRAELHILEALRVRLPYASYRVCAGPETDETNPKVVSRRNQIIAGIDPVLIDAYGCVNFFDTLPDELPYLMRAFESGIGSLDLENALEDGRLRLLQIGAPLELQPTASEPATAPTEAATLAAASNQPAGTATPRPTATLMSEEAGPLAVGIHAAAPESCAEVVDPRPFLGPALAPAAMVIAGAGLAARAVTRRKSQSTGGDDGE